MSESSNGASKRQNYCSSGNEDRISKLPDELLAHILSFLNSKNLVRTSVLSKGWRNKWTLAPNDFDLEDSNFPVRTRECTASFRRFVNRVLSVRAEKSVSKRFSLRTHNSYSSYVITSWISSAFAVRLEELDLFVVEPVSVKLPDLVFSSFSLKFLKLNFRIDVDVPEFVWLPCLKILHLEDLLHLTGRFIEKILSGSPNIEELVIVRYKTDGVDDLVSIRSSSLKSFKFENWFNLDGEVKVVLDTPSLECLDLNIGSFDIYLSEKFEIDVKHPSSILKASFMTCGCCATTPNGERDSVVQLLRQMCNVQVLCLPPKFLAALCDATTYNLPSYYNLTQLDISLCGNEWSFLPLMLNSCPSLKVLVLNKYDCHGIPSGLFDEENTVLKCLLSSLESFAFIGFLGWTIELQKRVGDFELVRYFLKNAKILQRFRIYANCCDHRGKAEIIMMELSKYPRASDTCQFILS